MTLNRQTIGKIDKQILSQMDHDEGVQLVKVPLSEAVWSTLRRYCEAVGIPMGVGACREPSRAKTDDEISRSAPIDLA